MFYFLYRRNQGFFYYFFLIQKSLNGLDFTDKYLMCVHFDFEEEKFCVG